MTFIVTAADFLKKTIVIPYAIHSWFDWYFLLVDVLAVIFVDEISITNKSESMKVNDNSFIWSLHDAGPILER